MVAPVVDTLEIIDGYLEALTSHGDFAKFFSDEVVATLEGTKPQTFTGKEEVRKWILSAHALGEVKVKDIFACKAHAGGEFDFIRNDGIRVPYSVIYDFRDDKITALKLYFTGPIG